MTEEEWLSDDLSTVRAIEQFASVRQMRLIGAALVRRLQDCSLDGDEPKRCADLIESMADAPRPWDDVMQQLERRPGNWRLTHILYPTQPIDVAKELRKLIAFYAHPADAVDHAFWLIREVGGNPFRPRAVLARWRTPDVLALCAGLYEQTTFDRLPIVADALEDAGCNDADLLAHLRSPGLHIRGCWALDRILGKE